MSVYDAGPGNNTAEIFAGYPPTCAVEAHVGGALATQAQNNPSYAVSYTGNGALSGSGINPLPPSAAGFVDPSQDGTNYAGNLVTPINTTYVTPFGATGVTIAFCNPAAIMFAFLVLSMIKWS